MTPELRNPIGTHVTVGKGLVAGALASVEEVGYEALQVFTGNPRGWALSAGRPAEDERFREECARRGLRAFIHAPYLVNPGSPTPLTWERSVATVATLSAWAISASISLRCDSGVASISANTRMTTARSSGR